MDGPISHYIGASWCKDVRSGCSYVSCRAHRGTPRLHIDKELLRDWWQDFAHLMRDPGIAANAAASSKAWSVCEGTCYRADATSRPRPRFAAIPMSHGC
jgi:hypothetical protein